MPLFFWCSPLSIFASSAMCLLYNSTCNRIWIGATIVKCYKMTMERKVRGEDGGTPVLIPMSAEQFFDRIREIVHEEVAATIGHADSRTNDKKLHIEGLANKPLYDMDEIRQLFSGVSRSTIYDWIAEGLLRPKKMKGRVYFLWNDIERMLNGGQ